MLFCCSARLWLGTSRREIWRLRAQKSAYCCGQSFDLTARMTAAAPAMQPFQHRRRRQIFFRQRETLLLALCRWFRRPAPHPQQPFQVHASCRGRCGVECVRHVDPGTHPSGLRQARYKFERNGGSPRALRTDQFGQRSHGQAAAQYFIQRVNTSGRNRPNDPLRRR